MSGQNQDRSGKYSTFFTDSTKIPLKGNFIKENNFKDNRTAQGSELQPVTVEKPEAVTVMKLPTPQLGDLSTK